MRQLMSCALVFQSSMGILLHLTHSSGMVVFYVGYLFSQDINFKVIINKGILFELFFIEHLSSFQMTSTSNRCAFSILGSLRSTTTTSMKTPQNNDITG